MSKSNYISKDYLALQHNDLISLPLRKFSASEVDIFLAICFGVEGHQSETVTLNLKDIKKLSNFRSKDEERFINELKKTNEKLMSLNFTVGDSKTEFTQFVFFPKFKVSVTAGILEVKIADEFQYLLNDLRDNYTSLELKESTSLKSSYSKAIYKQLRRFKSTGFWTVSIEMFKELLDIPPSYQMSHIDRNILEPAKKELRKYFKGLDYNKIYENKTPGKAGRSHVAGIEWRFQAVVNPNKANKINKDEQEHIAEQTKWIKTGRYCPKCKKPIYSKSFSNEYGSYVIYGHTNWKTGDCDYTTYDFSDLITKEKIEREKESEITISKTEREQIKANKEKLNKLTEGLFESIQ